MGLLKSATFESGTLSEVTLMSPGPTVSIDTGIVSGSQYSAKILNDFGGYAWNFGDYETSDRYYSADFKGGSLPSTEHTLFSIQFWTMYTLVRWKPNGGVKLLYWSGGAFTTLYDGSANQITAGTTHNIKVAAKTSNSTYKLRINDVVIDDAIPFAGTPAPSHGVLRELWTPGTSPLWWDNIYISDDDFYTPQYPTPANPGVATIVKL